MNELRGKLCALWQLVFFLCCYPTQLFAAPFFSVVANGSTLTIQTLYPNHHYPNVGIKFNSPGFSVSSCTQNSNGYCTFSVSDTAPKNLTISGPAGSATMTLCLNATAPLTCQAYTVGQRFAYITDFSGFIELCSVNTSTGVLSNCSSTGPGSGTPYDGPQAVILNPTGSYAYVLNLGSVTGFIQLCPINSTTGAFGNCVTLSQPVISASTSPNSMAIDPTGLFAYIGIENASSITVCSVDPTTGLLSNCSLSGEGTSSIAISSDDQRAYTISTANSVPFICSISSSSGALFGCALANIVAPWSNASFIALNAAASQAYIIGQGVTEFLQVCTVDSLTGALGNCFISSAANVNTVALTLNATNTFAYLVNNFAEENIKLCVVNQQTGDLNSCAATATGITFTNLNAITLR